MKLSTVLVIVTFLLVAGIYAGGPERIRNWVKFHSPYAALLQN